MPTLAPTSSSTPKGKRSSTSTGADGDTGGLRLPDGNGSGTAEQQRVRPAAPLP